MKDIFKIVQLSKPKNMQCELVFEEKYFSLSLDSLPQDRFDALFKYVANDWSIPKYAEVEHQGFDEFGYPFNPVFVQVTHEKAVK